MSKCHIVGNHMYVAQILVLKRCFIKGLHCAYHLLSQIRCYNFRAMLGNPPVPPYGRDLHDDATEVENYEVNNKAGILVKLETF